MKHLQEELAITLPDLEVGNDFLDMASKQSNEIHIYVCI